MAVVVLVQAASGRRWVVKQLRGAPTGAAASEAEGLRALAATRTLAVPRLHHHGPDGLVLEVLSSRPEDAEFYETLGRDLAAMQKVATSAQHGWAKDNHLGELPQRNDGQTCGRRPGRVVRLGRGRCGHVPAVLTAEIIRRLPRQLAGSGPT